MKVLLDTTILPIRVKRKTNTRLKESPNEVTGKEYQLPDYMYSDKRIYNISPVSFGAKVSVTNEKLLKEIEALKVEKEGLLTKVIDEVVKDAQDNLDRIRDWERSKGIKYYSRSERWILAVEEARKAAKQAKESYLAGHGETWKFFHGDGSKQFNSAYHNKKDEIFGRYSREIERLKEKQSTYESIANLANQNEEARQKRISEIDKLIDAKQKLINYHGLQDKINDMLSAKGGIDDRIAGYENVKEELNTKFVQKLIQSQYDVNTAVPSAVILYGATGTGKTTFLRGIRDAAEEGGYAEVVDLSFVLGGGGYEDTLNTFIGEAKDRYFNEHKRTIFLLNDAEKIFSIKEKDASLMGITLDDQDRNMLQAFGNNYNRISYFKALLDAISKTPVKGHRNDNRAAATFFITTNYPHLIHPDLLSREGKAIKIAVGLPYGHDMAEVLKFYFKKMDVVLDTLKAFKNNPDYVDSVNAVAGLTTKARANIIKMIEDGTIDKLKVDYENMPYEKITSVMNPNTQKGAYSNDGLRVICEKAFNYYLEQDVKDLDFKPSFYQGFASTGRDINSARLKKFNLIDRMMKDDEIAHGTLDELIHKNHMNLLSEKEAAVFKYYQTKIDVDLKKLEEIEQKEPLTAAQAERKARLTEYKAKINAAENENSYDVGADDF